MNEALEPTPTPQAGRWQAWKQRGRVVFRWTWPLALIGVAALAGVFLSRLLYPPPVLPSQKQVDANIYQVMASATPAPAYSADVYQTILPSLVLIRTKEKDAGDGEEGFGVGSGVVVNESGDILTAFHVVSNAAVIEVYFADGSQSTAQLVAAEPENDIALLHPDQPPELIVPAVLGSSNGVRIGDEAFVVGNPLGLAASMSAGVISGFNRTITIQDSEQELEGLIQFDTAVNPGSSGGPLLNRWGQVVGIVTALANPSEQNFFIGIGFAVPIGTALATAGGPSY